MFANSRPSASNFKSFSRLLDHFFFLKVGQNSFWKQNTIFPPSVSRVFLQWGSLLEERETKGIVYGSGIPCNCIPSQMLLHISNVLTLWVLIKHLGKIMGGVLRELRVIFVPYLINECRLFQIRLMGKIN